MQRPIFLYNIVMCPQHQHLNIQALEAQCCTEPDLYRAWKFDPAQELNKWISWHSTDWWTCRAGHQARNLYSTLLSLLQTGQGASAVHIVSTLKDAWRCHGYFNAWGTFETMQLFIMQKQQQLWYRLHFHKEKENYGSVINLHSCLLYACCSKNEIQQGAPLHRTPSPAFLLPSFSVF